MIKKILPLLVLFNFFWLNAQLDFYNNEIINEDASVSGASEVLLSDVDGDGDLDVISSSYAAKKIGWQENIDGQGTFGNLKLITENAYEVRSLFDVDIEGDGDIDLISASDEDGKIAWYENDGQGNFGSQNILVEYASAARSVFGSDIDGDGDIDIVASYDCCTIAWFENLDGQGNFGTANSIAYLSNPSSMYLDDLDGDGDMDIVTNSLLEDNYIKIVWLKNLNGQGVFGSQEVIHTYIPEMNYSVVSQVYVSDIDADGDKDVIYTANNQMGWIENTDALGNFTSSPANIVYQNNLRNRFVSVKTKDMDNDGDLDIITGGTEWHDPERIAWYENLDGLGNFSSTLHTVNRDTEGIASIAVEDIDDDGNVDILGSSRYEHSNVFWLKNSGDNIDFGDQKIISRYWYTPSRSRAIDLDNDNDLDIIYIVNLNTLVWYENLDGLGNFSNQIVLSTEASGKLQFSDINNDGHIDIVTSYGNNLMWLENFGQGNFSTPNEIIANPNVASTAFPADIDGDGDDDIVSINHVNTSSNYLAYNENLDGLGTFGPFEVITSMGSNKLSHLEIRDFDGDNDNDIVYTGVDGSGNSGQMGWIENTGGLGNFGPKTTIFNDECNIVKSVDLDEDGDLDLIAAMYEDQILAWFENVDGLGGFSNRRIISEANSYGSRNIYPADIDGDGDMDIVSSSHEESSVFWYENLDGSNFGSEHVITNTVEEVNSAFPGDINGDGKLDIIVTQGDDDHAVSWYSNSGLLSNRLSGIIRLDIDNDGCDNGDTRMANLMVSTTNGTESISTFTNNAGYYQLYPTEEGMYTTTIESNLDFYDVVPNAVDSNFTGFGTIENADFCFTANQLVNDLKISIIPLGDARPGFTSSYAVTYQNVGTVVQSGTLSVDFDDTKLSFLSATESVLSQTSNQLTFEYDYLNPLEIRTIRLEFQIFPPPTVNIDETLTFTGVINPIPGDNNPVDNTIQFDQILIGSYDPNDITVLEGPQITINEVDEYLHYIIRFQNTGTASAINVQVENNLDPNLDPSSFIPEYVSHNHFIELRNNSKLKFIFNNINLPDSTSNEPGSHGYIAYKIKPRNTAAIGDVMKNTADIYFDFNPAIITNTVSTEIVEPLSVVEFHKNNVAIYPNPTKGLCTIRANHEIEKLTICDINGRQLKAVEVKNSLREYQLNIRNLSKGIYFVKTQTDLGIQTQKLIKQ
ncbi:T9SS type A sorting domain-containing protein [uncultured Kordia sp.]|uniref:T9SS type A sorting domain-containing protein n=1 Tax=uncultured Kordia sp. TaxID=507699 RepID=UPI002624739E|nr:T9SS type A sorting domain-containing protein [uncultured Kordia sp.]